MGFLTATTTGELDLLRTFALHQLAQVRTTVVGLSDAQAHATPTVSALNLTGLLRHCGFVAVMWSHMAARAPKKTGPPDEFADARYEITDCIADRSSLAETLELFDRCTEFAADRMSRVHDLSAPVPVLEAPWLPDDLQSWEARWALAHICTEVARHAGHADIIRETIDGKGAFELNDLADRAES